MPEPHGINQMNKENIIENVFIPSEIAEAQKRLCEIRFDCLVKMYDFGQRINGGGFLEKERPQPPQWFKIHNQLTLEFVKHEDERTIGRFVKEMFGQLQYHIEKYEKVK